ncbi:MAG: M55 family metallopeptidase, partial [Anaerolineae bacterium]|nr:M55 family metallopeptidase [Anaerolineae bacterium]
CFPPAVTHPQITRGVKLAVEKFREGKAPAPLKVECPVHMSARFATPIMAEQALVLPQLSAMPDGRMVSFEAPDILTAYQVFRAATNLIHPWVSLLALLQLLCRTANWTFRSICRMQPLASCAQSTLTTCWPARLKPWL